MRAICEDCARAGLGGCGPGNRELGSVSRAGAERCDSLLLACVARADHTMEEAVYRRLQLADEAKHRGSCPGCASGICPASGGAAAGAQHVCGKTFSTHAEAAKDFSYIGLARLAYP